MSLFISALFLASALVLTRGSRVNEWSSGRNIYKVDRADNRPQPYMNGNGNGGGMMAQPTGFY